MSRARWVTLLQGLVALGLTLLVLTGCGGSHGDGNDSASRVRIALQTTTEDQRPRRRVSSRTATAQPRQAVPDDIGFVASIQITITGPDLLEDVVETLPVTADQQERFVGRFTKTVPPGNNRTICVTAFNGSNIEILRGETTVALGPQAEGCREVSSTDLVCQVMIRLTRRAVWGSFSWGGSARWGQ